MSTFVAVNVLMTEVSTQTRSPTDRAESQAADHCICCDVEALGDHALPSQTSVSPMAGAEEETGLPGMATTVGPGYRPPRSFDAGPVGEPPPPPTTAYSHSPVALL